MLLWMTERDKVQGNAKNWNIRYLEHIIQTKSYRIRHTAMSLGYGPESYSGTLSLSWVLRYFWKPGLKLLFYRKFVLDLNPDCQPLKCFPLLRTVLFTQQNYTNVMDIYTPVTAILLQFSVPQNVGSHPICLHSFLYCHILMWEL